MVIHNETYKTARVNVAIETILWGTFPKMMTATEVAATITHSEKKNITPQLVRGTYIFGEPTIIFDIIPLGRKRKKNAKEKMGTKILKQVKIDNNFSCM